MKKTTPFTPWSILLSLALPCLPAYLLRGYWFPFLLAGKAFLVFYLVHMLTGYIVLILNRERCYRNMTGTIFRKQVILFFLISVTLSLARIAQGAYHHKPVGFLILLTVLHSFILAVVLGKTQAGTIKKGNP